MPALGAYKGLALKITTATTHYSSGFFFLVEPDADDVCSSATYSITDRPSISHTVGDYSVVTTTLAESITYSFSESCDSCDCSALFRFA